ncbi:phosphoglycerate mutase family protein [Cytophagales bacterium LB-30]|uniref:Phosphoglycerate mutase family protein n=1 Tax=Shiella aurantiaca TaxID=3058365 RepID=A0ABT8F413_9BACT|nr:phosphoglycerate mutase family protein [Shiella aurantiaca]MDN4165128.1 phosphoglycerate mutase family protein [Shiella aurantiaca]
MRTLLLAFFLLLSASLGALAQSSPNDFVTIYLTRHAEKKLESTPDPNLSDLGVQRAERLAKMLKKVAIDSLYSTDLKRTRQTLAFLAEQKSLGLNLYTFPEQESLARRLRTEFGKCYVVSGHSNTIPAFVNALLGEERVQEIYDTEYDNLFVVKIHRSGSISLDILQY